MPSLNNLTRTLIVSAVALSVTCVALPSIAKRKAKPAPRFPKGCYLQRVHFDNNMVAINTPTTDENENQIVTSPHEKQTLFFFHNISDKTLILTHPNPSNAHFLVGSWDKSIQPGKWAAFAVDSNNFIFECKTTDRLPRGGRSKGKKKANNMVAEPTAANCAEVVDICQYAKAKFAISNYGSYWVPKQGSAWQMIKRSARRGILMRR